MKLGHAMDLFVSSIRILAGAGLALALAAIALALLHPGVQSILQSLGLGKQELLQGLWVNTVCYGLMLRTKFPGLSFQESLNAPKRNHA